MCLAQGSVVMEPHSCETFWSSIIYFLFLKLYPHRESSALNLLLVAFVFLVSKLSALSHVVDTCTNKWIVNEPLQGTITANDVIID